MRRKSRAVILALMAAGVFAVGRGAMAADEPHVTKLAGGEAAAGEGPFHATGVISGRSNDLWVATEGQGVWNLASGAWIQYDKSKGAASGPADDFTYALALDRKGRLWVGTLNHGVSVFNGQAWQTYNSWGPIAGPVGGHVTALAVSPKSGDVWITTDSGVTRYSESADNWKTYGRAEGLPTDQFRGVNVTPNGDVYLATAIDGLLIGRDADGFKTWEQIKGPEETPAVSTGVGLSSREINCIASDADGHIFVGTPNGLCISKDNGKSWRFVRGKDWIEKVQRRYQGAPDGWVPAGDALLSEDWVTCTWVDAEGKLWVGHREHGYERIDPASGEVLVSQEAAPMLDTGKAAVNYVRGIAAGLDGRVLIGRYLVPPTWCDLGGGKVNKAASVKSFNAGGATLPTPAAAPTADDLKGWEAKLAALPAAVPGKSAAGGYIGEDWNTQGDWVAHFGRQYARFSTSIVYAAEGYGASVIAGGHYANLPMGSYLNTLPAGARRGLWDPSQNKRDARETNDGGFEDSVASTAVQGPDLWVKVNIPKIDTGAHRISIYMMSPDGQTSRNSLRDFVLELRHDPQAGENGAGDTDPAEILSLQERLALEKIPIIARARASDLYAGAYEEFVVNQPGLYWVKVEKNYSFVTKLFGVFVDRVGVGAEKGAHALEWPAKYEPVAPASPSRATPALALEALRLWTAAEAAWGKPGAEAFIHRAEMAAYRAADAVHADPMLLATWRWKLGIWGAWDRSQFDANIAENASPE